MWRNIKNAVIIRFLKSSVFALVSAVLAWCTWDKQWAGAVPALAFMAAFYAVLWMVYNLAADVIVRFWGTTVKRTDGSSKDKKTQ